MTHGEQIRNLMVKISKSHQSVNHTVKEIKLSMSKDAAILKTKCFDADGELFIRTYSTPITDSIPDTLHVLSKNF